MRAFVGVLGVVRAAQWFMLGLSLAPLLRNDNAVGLIRSTSLTLEEYEHEVSDFATQKMVRPARHRPCTWRGRAPTQKGARALSSSPALAKQP